MIARAAGSVNVQLNLADWNNFSIKHDKRAGSPLQEMIWAFMEEDRLEPLPLDDLVNLYEWSYPLKHWRASWKLHDGEGAYRILSVYHLPSVKPMISLEDRSVTCWRCASMS